MRIKFSGKTIFSHGCSRMDTDWETHKTLTVTDAHGSPRISAIKKPTSLSDLTNIQDLILSVKSV
jgi:hypothetical protein